MKTYTIEVTEYHEVKKTYYIDADTKSDAKKRAKNNDWDEASGDEPTGIISKIKINSIVKEVA